MTHELVGLRRVAAGFMAVFVGVIAGVGTVYANASMANDPDGSETNTEFSDANGSLELQRPTGNRTWCAAYGELTAVDIDATQQAEGTVIDNKQHTGVIQEAVVPVWLWQVKAGMQVNTHGYVGTSFSEDEDLTGWGRAELLYEGEGQNIYEACEVKTSNQTGTGSYDITVEDLLGNEQTITDGAQSWAPEWAGGGAGGGSKEISIDQQFAKQGFGVQFKYESRAKCYVNLGFDEEDSVSNIDVDVMHFDSNGLGEWEGVAFAWDYNPYYGPMLLGAFVLDPQ